MRSPLLAQVSGIGRAVRSPADPEKWDTKCVAITSGWPTSISYDLIYAASWPTRRGITCCFRIRIETSAESRLVSTKTLRAVRSYTHTHTHLCFLLRHYEDQLDPRSSFGKLKSSISIFFYLKYSRAGTFERIDLHPATFDRSTSEGEEIGSGTDRSADPHDVF